MPWFCLHCLSARRDPDDTYREINLAVFENVLFIFTFHHTSLIWLKNHILGLVSCPLQVACCLFAASELLRQDRCLRLSRIGYQKSKFLSAWNRYRQQVYFNSICMIGNRNFDSDKWKYAMILFNSSIGESLSLLAPKHFPQNNYTILQHSVMSNCPFGASSEANMVLVCD